LKEDNRFQLNNAKNIIGTRNRIIHRPAHDRVECILQRLNSRQRPPHTQNYQRKKRRLRRLYAFSRQARRAK
jgi:hypothetical protein